MTSYTLAEQAYVDAGDNALQLQQMQFGCKWGLAGTAVSGLIGPFAHRDPLPSTLYGIWLNSPTGPTGATPLLVDILYNGATIFGTPGNRPSLTAGATSIWVPASAASVTSYAPANAFTCNIVTVGSTIAGSNVSVELYTYPT